MTETAEEKAAREAEEAAAQAAENEGEGEGEGGEGEQKPSGKSFNQDDVDKAIEKRLARERKRWEREQEEAKKKAEMSEAERFKAEKEESEKKATEAQERANQTLIRAEAKVTAVAAGVKAERVAKFLKLVDLAEVEVGEDGEPDADAIKAAIDAALEDVPEFKGEAGKSGTSGADLSGSNTTRKWTQAEVDKLSPAEYEKHRDEIMAQVRAGTVK